MGTCSRVKPSQEFDGKATCNHCRLRKRKFADQAKIRRVKHESSMGQENKTLREMLAAKNLQLREATQWQSEAQRLSVLVSRHQLEIRQLQDQLAVFRGQQVEPGHSVAQPSMHHLHAYCNSAQQQPPIEADIRYTVPDAAASVYPQGIKKVVYGEFAEGESSAFHSGRQHGRKGAVCPESNMLHLTEDEEAKQRAILQTMRRAGELQALCEQALLER